MDLDKRIVEAAKDAIGRLELNDVDYDGQFIHNDSDRVTVHFREGTKYFSVTIILGNHPTLFAQTSVEALTDQITDELRKRDE